MSDNELTVDPNQYIIKDESYYEPVADEVELYKAAYSARMLKGLR